MFGSNFRDFVSQDPAEIKDERLTKSCPEFGKLDSGDSGNCSETEEGKSSDREAVLTPQDDNSLIQSLIGNIGEGPKSFIIEGDEEESFVIAPKNLTFTEMKDILNGKIDDIQDYENRLITDLGGLCCIAPYIVSKLQQIYVAISNVGIPISVNLLSK